LHFQSLAEKNGYNHIEYELGQRGAPLNWFTNSSDYQSQSPSAVVQLQQEEELASLVIQAYKVVAIRRRIRLLQYYQCAKSEVRSLVRSLMCFL
jgi:hypothetical protein